jgi:two-component system sensor histidine kinase RegB
MRLPEQQTARRTMPARPTAFSASRQNLIRLVMIRALIALLQTVALVFAAAHLQLPLPYPELMATLALSMLATLHATWLLRGGREPSDPGFFMQLLADIVQLAAFLYFAGGATNPFVSYFLVPVCVAAAILPARYTWFATGITLLAYSVLLFRYHPVALLEMSPHGHHEHGAAPAINPHILGMWVNFLLSAVLIAVFVVRMASTVREQQKALHDARETALQQDQLVAVATLAAGTAHELGTPLATMTMLAEELQGAGSDAQRQQDLAMLQLQLQRCRAILQKLGSTAEFGNAGAMNPVGFDNFMQSTLEHWQVTHPEHSLQVRWPEHTTDVPLVMADTIVQQALINLLNNAARAAKTCVSVELQWDAAGGCVIIDDDGPGLPADVIARLGQPLATSQGLGIGLFLSHAAIRRHGGQLQLGNREGGGARATVQLPAHHDGGAQAT